jgi:Cu+-exporting ATPase
MGVAKDKLQTAEVRFAEAGKTPPWVAIGGRLTGIIAVADTIKRSSITTIRQMHAEGRRVVMLTGDHKRAAEATAREAGIDEMIANMPPAGKRLLRFRAAPCG